MTKTLLIAGASVRPWVASALAAGYRVQAVDFFADWDLLQLENDEPAVVSVESISEFAQISGLSNLGSCDAAVVCGGLENQIDLLQRVELVIPILGTHSRNLGRLRDAMDVNRRLQDAGFLTPEFKSKLSSGDDNRTWLRKTNGSSGGLGVQWARSKECRSVRDDVFYQAHVVGENVSAVFVSSRDSLERVTTSLLGVTQQLVGRPQFGASEFSYCGSIGPVDLSDPVRTEIESVGRYLADQFEILGAWGIDFIINAEGVCPVDVNARLTASMELFEAGLRSSGDVESIVDLHVKACLGKPGAVGHVCEGFKAPSVEGKAILFNNTTTAIEVDHVQQGAICRMFDREFFESNATGFSVADVPKVGDRIRPGSPILTLRVRDDEGRVLSLLETKASEILRLLG